MHSDSNLVNLKKLVAQLGMKDPFIVEEALDELGRHRHGDLELSEEIVLKLRQLFFYTFPTDYELEIEIRRKALIVACIYFQEKDAFDDVIRLLNSGANNSYLFSAAVDCLATLGRYPEVKTKSIRELAIVASSKEHSNEIRLEAYRNLLQLTGKITIAEAAKSFAQNSKIDFDFNWLNSLLEN